MHAQTAMIENGFIHLLKEAGWLPGIAAGIDDVYAR